jgi:hypothetical protein
VKLTTFLQLVLRLQICEAMHPLPTTPYLHLHGIIIIINDDVSTVGQVIQELILTSCDPLH